jgi:hypothetical protein
MAEVSCESAICRPSGPPPTAEPQTAECLNTTQLPVVKSFPRWVRFPRRSGADLQADLQQSIWREFGATRLAFEEYLLIGVASELFPHDLLNLEGRNRLA